MEHDIRQLATGKVWLVAKEKGPKRYYGTRNIRVYATRAGALQFIKSNPNSEFIVYESEVDWQEIDQEDI